MSARQMARAIAAIAILEELAAAGKTDELRAKGKLMFLMGDEFMRKALSAWVADYNPTKRPVLKGLMSDCISISKATREKLATIGEEE